MRQKIIPIMMVICSLVWVTGCQEMALHHPKVNANAPDPLLQTLADEGEKAFAKHDYTGAIELYTKLLDQLSPSGQEDIPGIDRERCRLHLADAYRLQGAFTKAINQYRQIDKTQTGDSVLSAMEGEAIADVQLGMLNDAEMLLQKVIKRDATRERTLNALGVIQALRGNTTEANAYFEMALQVADHAPSALANAGLALVLSGEVKEGVRRLEAAQQQLTTQDQHYARIANNLAMAYVFDEQTDQAVALLSKTMKKAAVYNNIGYFSMLKGQEKLAKAYLMQALNASPSYYAKADRNLNAVTPK